MSYDIYLFIPEPNVDLVDSYQTKCESGLNKLTDEQRQSNLRVLSRLQKEEPQFCISQDDNSTAVTDPLGIQISFFADSGGASVPFWYSGGEAEKVFTRLVDYLVILGQEFSYHAFDPQLEEFFSLRDRHQLHNILAINEHTTTTISSLFSRDV